MKNPIYIQYYSHEKSLCYKIDLPYTNYDKDIRVLCKVSDGYEKARELAKEAIIENFMEATEEGEVSEKVNM